MSHRTIVICDRCGTRDESKPGKAYPEGWAIVSIRAFTYNDVGGQTGTKQDHDVCPVCMGGINTHLAPLSAGKRDA